MNGIHVFEFLLHIPLCHLSRCGVTIRPLRNLDAVSMVMVEIENSQLANSIGSYALSRNPDLKPIRVIRSDTRQDDGSRYVITLGVGKHVFYDGPVQYSFTRIERGDPVPSRSSEKDAVVYESVVLDAPSHIDAMRLCDKSNVIEDIDGRIQVLSWRADSEYYSRTSISYRREFDSVILEPAVRERLLLDIEEFQSPETQGWYRTHGIPFRRGYMFHGPPGCGKTSLITSLATRLKRRIHKICLVCPRMTDDCLAQAMADVRSPAIMVFEDVDALFDHHRNKTEQCMLTFSGLLNAIDGVGDASTGALIIFTTNHIDRIDAALLRRGRVDNTFFVGPATSVTSRLMFGRFYPQSDVRNADNFVSSVESYIPRPTPADLQEHFIAHRTATAEDAQTFVLSHANDSATCSTMFG